MHLYLFIGYFMVFPFLFKSRSFLTRQAVNGLMVLEFRAAHAREMVARLVLAQRRAHGSVGDEFGGAVGDPVVGAGGVRSKDKKQIKRKLSQGVKTGEGTQSNSSECAMSIKYLNKHAKPPPRTVSWGRSGTQINCNSNETQSRRKFESGAR
jgi:hypothetical protein